MAERFVHVAALCWLLSGCGAQTADPTSESNTNWLKSCDRDAQCGDELACHCGVCTQNCKQDSCPGTLACLALCGDSAASCQAECQEDADCAYLASNASCASGVCTVGSRGLSEQRVNNASPSDTETDAGQSTGPGIEDAQFDDAVVSPEDVRRADTTGAAWRLIEVPAATNDPSLVRTPDGWLSFSSRTLGDSRSPSGYETALYRSVDGVHWQSLALDLPHDDTDFGNLAYGAGRYVTMGRRLGAVGVVWSSSDLEHWTEVEQSGDSVNQWGRVAYAGSYFFGFGFQYLGVSEDGVDWQKVPISTVQVMAATYGNGRYLLVGSGPMQTSDDGLSWQPNDVDCSLPGACDMTPPTPSDSGEPSGPGEIFQGYQTHALFAEGRFYTDQLSSPDGVMWQALPGRIPAQYVAGHFLGPVDLNLGIPTWTSDGDVEALRVVRPAREAATAQGRRITSVGVLSQDEPLPDSVDVGFDDGLTCETATCVQIENRLVLIPPLGSPPLEDRVPRDADGAPLLSDDCPVSNQLFCDDYETRSGCVCEPEAPQGPEYCDDVSQYECEGQFSHQDGEWDLDEIREGGCDCDYVDPNQPLGFGTNCEADPNVCQEPLSCLQLEIPDSAGPPYQPLACTVACTSDADCPSWQATGYCAGPVTLRCAGGSCQPRSCE
jgi:hypothetical protein